MRPRKAPLAASGIVAVRTASRNRSNPRDVQPARLPYPRCSESCSESCSLRKFPSDPTGHRILCVSAHKNQRIKATAISDEREGPQYCISGKLITVRWVRPRSSRKKNGCCLLASARTIAAEMAARWWARKVRGEDRERPYRVESWVVGARACLPSSRRARSMVGKSAPVVSVTSRVPVALYVCTQ